jgi:hypothetical protein
MRSTESGPVSSKRRAIGVSMRKSFRDSTSTIAWLSLVIALVGGIPGAIAIKNDLFKKRVAISYDRNNTLLARLASDHKERFGKRVIAFYGMRFVGAGEVPSTIKRLQFYVKIGWWKWIEGARIDLYTNTVKGKRDNLIAGSNKDSLVMTEWVNFKEYSSDYYIERGKTVPFNVAFMFDSPEIENSNKWQFIITDFADEKYKTTIDSPGYLSLSAKNFLLFDCYLENPADVQELLKDKILDYKKIQTFLTSNYRYKPHWYD